MKKVLLLLSCLFLYCNQGLRANDIDFHPDTSSSSPQKHTPIRVPSATLEGYILSFDESCIGCPIILTQDNIIVYTGIVDENGTIVLPNNLAGVFELQLQRGSVTFVGEMEL